MNDTNALKDFLQNENTMEETILQQLILLKLINLNLKLNEHTR